LATVPATGRILIHKCSQSGSVGESCPDRMVIAG
jgi:hypothetical protein